jgi:hypothetical protein
MFQRDCPCRTHRRALRLSAAQIALERHASFIVKDYSLEGTGFYAIAAADALLHVYDPGSGPFIQGDRSHRTYRSAKRIFTLPTDGGHKRAIITLSNDDDA